MVRASIILFESLNPFLCVSFVFQVFLLLRIKINQLFASKCGKTTKKI